MKTNEERIWKPVTESPVELFNQLSRCFERHEQENPNCFPALRECSDIIVTSDYSGEHQQADHSVFSFLIFDWTASALWSIRSTEVREAFLSQGDREMAYKRLDDKHRQHAIAPFLEAADQINGLLITLLISKRVESLLEPEGVAYLQATAPLLAGWKHGTIEKLYRIQAFLGFLLTGLCRPDQRVYWLTDDDEIVANAERLETAWKMLRYFSRIHFGKEILLGSVDTVGSIDTRIAGPAKDLAAIPDLADGALVDMWAESEKDRQLGTRGKWISKPTAIPRKAKFITEWFCRSGKPLRRQVAAIDVLYDDPSRLSFHWLKFNEART